MASVAVRRVRQGDNEYIVVVRVTSGAGTRVLTAEQPIRVRVTDVDEPPAAPGAPTITDTTSDSLTVGWAEPAITGPPITGYDLQYREDGSSGFADAPHEGSGRTATLTGLSADTAYQVQVRARNEEGTGPWSEPGEGRTIAPLTVRMTTDLAPPLEGPFTLRFRFSGTVTGFTGADIATQQAPPCTDTGNNPVPCNPSFAALQTTDDQVFTTIVTPRTGRVADNYTLRITVRANTVTSVPDNKPNEAATLEVRVAPPGVTVPISSLGLTASPSNGQVALGWNTPANTGGGAIIRYEYRWAEPGGEFSDWVRVGPAERAATVPDLTNGREYVFELRGGERPGLWRGGDGAIHPGDRRRRWRRWRIDYVRAGSAEEPDGGGRGRPGRAELGRSGQRRRGGDHGLRVPDQRAEPLDLHRFHPHHPYGHRPRQRHGIHLRGAGGQQNRQGQGSQPSRGLHRLRRKCLPWTLRISPMGMAPPPIWCS